MLEQSDRARRDIAHHLHPYTNPRSLERDGPLVITRGEGVYVFDEHGRRYIEAMSGLWCAALGFSEERLIRAAERQLRTLPYYHSFSGKAPGVVADLAERLIGLAPPPIRGSGHVMFAASGSESNDTAVKLVRYFNNALGRPLKKKIIARVKGYHGVTLAAASLSGMPAMHSLFDLPLPDTLHVGAPHAYQYAAPGESEEAFVARLVAELEQTILREGPETIAAFIAEPVQGAGGVLIPPAGYFAAVQAVLRRYDILLIADEVICGFGRLGEWFGSDHFGLQPDLMTVAKALTGAYMPMSALLISDRVYQVIADQGAKLGGLAHGYTYAGHPVACAVALEALDIYEERGLIGQARQTGTYLQQAISGLAAHPLVGQARGLGMIGALELAADPAGRRAFDPSMGVSAKVIARAQAHGAILRAMTGDVIAFSPPLIISRPQIDDLMAIVRVALDETLAILQGEL
jgi:4-aminobutyrate--pyruvate transaminase